MTCKFKISSPLIVTIRYQSVIYKVKVCHQHWLARSFLARLIKESKYTFLVNQSVSVDSSNSQWVRYQLINITLVYYYIALSSLQYFLSTFSKIRLWDKILSLYEKCQERLHLNCRTLIRIYQYNFSIICQWLYTGCVQITVPLMLALKGGVWTKMIFHRKLP